MPFSHKSVVKVPRREATIRRIIERPCPLLLPFAFPCFFVVLRVGGGAQLPDWVPWTAGVLTMDIIGGAMGVIFQWVRAC